MLRSMQLIICCGGLVRPLSPSSKRRVARQQRISGIKQRTGGCQKQATPQRIGCNLSLLLYAFMSLDNSGAIVILIMGSIVIIYLEESV